MVADEVHFYRTVCCRYVTRAGAVKTKGVFTTAAVEAAKDATKRLLMTATSVYNRPVECFNLVQMAKGRDVVHPSDGRRLYTYADLKKNFENRSWARAFVRGVFSVFHRRDSRMYPAAYEHARSLVMDPAYYAAYVQIQLEAGEIAALYNNPTVFMTGLRRAANRIPLPQVPKVAATLDILGLPAPDPENDGGDDEPGKGQTTPVLCVGNC
jgi:ribosomal protein L16/L10AE